MNARLHVEPPDRAAVAAGARPEQASTVQQSAPLLSPRTQAVKPLQEYDPQDARAETIRALRTELLLRREAQGAAELIALLSPCRGEGRSQLAAELAVAFAQLGRPTLLVDADLRHPGQHRLFGADNRLGLANALANGVTPQCHAVEGLPNLFLVPAGDAPAQPLELLLHDHFARLIHDWRRGFEFVLFDTAPTTPYSDGLAVAHRVGRVLALSRARHTPYRANGEMLRRLGATGAQVIGAVISHF